MRFGILCRKKNIDSSPQTQEHYWSLNIHIFKRVIMIFVIDFTWKQTSAHFFKYVIITIVTSYFWNGSGNLGVCLFLEYIHKHTQKYMHVSHKFIHLNFFWVVLHNKVLPLGTHSQQTCTTATATSPNSVCSVNTTITIADWASAVVARARSQGDHHGGEDSTALLNAQCWRRQRELRRSPSITKNGVQSSTEAVTEPDSRFAKSEELLECLPRVADERFRFMAMDAYGSGILNRMRLWKLARNGSRRPCMVNTLLAC